MEKRTKVETHDNCSNFSHDVSGLNNPTKADYASLDDNGDDYISKPELMKFVVKMSKQQSAEFGKNKAPVVKVLAITRELLRRFEEFKKPKRSNGGGTAEVKTLDQFCKANIRMFRIIFSYFCSLFVRFLKKW